MQLRFNLTSVSPGGPRNRSRVRRGAHAFKRSHVTPTLPLLFSSFVVRLSCAEERSNSC
jgi:hypothetical protein